MLGITNYLKHDLEGVYTAELLRGTISMFLGICLTYVFNLEASSTYILIVALYGLRPITPFPFIKRLIFMIGSLILLTLTLEISIYLGHEGNYLLGGLFSIILSGCTVYCLARIPPLSGTIMFMSVFSIINFGMGVIDVNKEVDAYSLLYASILGSLCVIASLILVPIIRFHYCAIINYCFFHELKSFSKRMSKTFYKSFTELKPKVRTKLLMHQTALMNICKYIQDPVRRKLYLELLNDLSLISYWPSSNSEDSHLNLINSIRTNTFMFIYKLLTKKKQRALILKEINDFSDSLKNISHSDFCNGEMIGLTINLLNNIASLINYQKEDSKLIKEGQQDD